MVDGIPWTCKDCGSQTYNDQMMREHQDESGHTMILGQVEDVDGNVIPPEEI